MRARTPPPRAHPSLSSAACSRIPLLTAAAGCASSREIRMGGTYGRSMLWMQWLRKMQRLQKTARRALPRMQGTGQDRRDSLHRLRGCTPPATWDLKQRAKGCIAMGVCYSCCGCGKCHAWIKPFDGTCLRCGKPVPSDSTRCPECSAPIPRRRPTHPDD